MRRNQMVNLDHLTPLRLNLILRCMRTSTYHAWDRALGGHLAEILTAYANEGCSAEEMTYRLRTDHDVKVSRSTVYRWLELAAA